MERNLKLQIVDEEFEKQKRSSRRVASYAIGFAIMVCVFCVGGFYALQHYVNHRINGNSKINGSDFDAVDTTTCRDELKKEDWGEDFESLSFYQMGWDKRGRPVWTFELGKLDIRGILNKNPENLAKIDALGTIAVEQIVCSMKQAEGKTGEKAWIIILNLQGYSLYQFTSYTVVDAMFSFFSKIIPMIDYTDYGYFINMNFVAYGLLKVFRPAIGEAINRVVIESDVDVWKASMKEKIPLEYIIPQFGGYSNYTCPTPFCTYYKQGF